MRILIGFTGHSANTKELIEKVSLFKKYDHDEYVTLCKKIGDVVNGLHKALQKGDEGKILSLITKNRKLLSLFEQKAGVKLETPELKKMCDLAEGYGGAAKFSGAGGGDCAIAVCFDDSTAKKIIDAWQKHDFAILY